MLEATYVSTDASVGPENCDECVHQHISPCRCAVRPCEEAIPGALLESSEGDKLSNTSLTSGDKTMSNLSVCSKSGKQDFSKVQSDVSLSTGSTVTTPWCGPNCITTDGVTSDTLCTEAQKPSSDSESLMGSSPGDNCLTRTRGAPEYNTSGLTPIMVAPGIQIPHGSEEQVGCSSSAHEVRSCDGMEKVRLLPEKLVFPAIGQEKVQSIHVLEPASRLDDSVLSSLPQHLHQLVPAVEFGPLPEGADARYELMTQERVKQVVDLLIEYQDVFVGPDGKVGYTDVTGHKIDTQNAEPIKARPFRKSMTEKQYIEEEVQRLLDAGQISPSKSPWAAPVVLVKKKDGSLRFCIDYRRLNQVTKKDAYPLPRIDECLEALNGCQWFTALDLASGYWQVAMEPGSREKTCFVTSSGLYEWNVMPFGLCNAPATFSRLMEAVLNGLIWRTCLVYLDDIITVGDTFERALLNLRGVFDRLRMANLKLKPKKCELFKHQVEYLGHTVSVEGIKPSASKIQALKVWKLPRDVHEIRSFLGFVSYYRKFIRMFAEMAVPLSDCTGSNYVVPPTGLNEAQRKAFEQLKDALMNHVMLNYVVEDRDWILDCDASNSAIGACLSQVDENGTEYLISCASKVLSKSRRHYCTTRKELFCVVYMLRYHRGYIRMCDPKRLTVRVDHGSLKWLLTFKFENELYRRWIAELQAYGDFHVEVRKGTKHTNADAVSRIITRDCRYDLCSDCKSMFRSTNKRLHDSDSTESDTPESSPATEGLALLQRSYFGVSPSLWTTESSWEDLSDVEMKHLRWMHTLAQDAKCYATTRQQARDSHSRPSNSATAGVPELRRSARVAARDRSDARERQPASSGEPDVRPRKSRDSRAPPLIKPNAKIKNDEVKTSEKKYKEVIVGSPTTEANERDTFDPCGQDGTRGKVAHGKECDKIARDLMRKGTSVSTPEGSSSDAGDSCDILSSLLPAYSLADWAAAQRNDHTLRRVLVLIQELDDLDMSDSMLVRKYYSEKDALVLKDDILCRRPTPVDTGASHCSLSSASTLQRVVPTVWQQEIFTRIHQIECLHFGFHRVYPQIWKRFYWVNMVSDLKNWLRRCDNCQHCKPGLMRELRVPVQDPMGEPLDRVAMDLAELPISGRGNRYLLVVQDYFSKYVELYALPTKESKPIAEVLHYEFFTRYGVPLKLYSDKGKEFDNALMDEFCTMWKVTRQTTCGYNPAANGMVERTNRTVKSLLTQIDHMIDKTREDWDLKLAEVRCAYNNTVHSTTGFTPHRLMFSQSCDARLPTDLFYETIESRSVIPKPLCYNAWLMDRREACQNASYQAQLRTVEALQNRAKQLTERKREYHVGQQVLRYYPPVANQKLNPQFDGPWTIKEINDSMNTVVLRLQVKSGKWVDRVVSFRHIKPYLSPSKEKV